jgi:hypothetical protein
MKAENNNFPHVLYSQESGEIVKLADFTAVKGNNIFGK